jgi:PAS domain S-box-containing protein
MTSVFPAWVARAFAPPTFADEDKTRTARVLDIVLLAILAQETLFQVPSSTRHPGVAAAVLLLVLSLRQLLRRGHVELVTSVTVGAFWTLVTVVSTLEGGVRSAAFPAYVLIVVGAGLLVGATAAVAWTALSLLAGLGMALAERGGPLPPPVLAHSTFTYWTASARTLVVALILVVVAGRSVREALSRARRELVQRRRAEADLLGRVRELSVLGSLAEIVVKEQDEDTLLGRATEVLRDGLRPDTCRVDLSDEDGGSPRRRTGPVSDVGREPAGTTDDTEIGSRIRAPLEVGGRVFGVLEMAKRKPDAFNEADEHLLLTVASQLATAIARLRTAEAVQGSEDRFRSLVQSSWDVLTIHDTAMNTLYVAPSVTRILGYEPEAFVRQHVLDLVHPDDLKRARRDFAEVVQSSNDGTPTELRIRKVDGSWAHVEVVGKNLLDLPAVQGIVLTSRDVTERRRTLAALQESEERFRRLAEAAFEGIVITEDGIVIDANPRLAQMLGCATAEIIGVPVTSLVAPVYREKVAAHIRSGSEEGYELQGLRSDGTVFPAEVRPRVMMEGGKPRRVTAVVDVTDRKRAEQALRKLSRAVEQSPVSIVITDTTGAIEYVNPRFTETTGYSLAEVLGANPRLLQSGLTLPEQYEHIWRTITAGREWRGELCNRRKNGELFWEASSISPLTDDTGAITHYIAITEQITERKRAEEEQARLQAALRRAADEWRLTFDALESAVLLLDREGRVMRLNRSAMAEAGASFEACIGRHVGGLGSGEPWQSAGQVVQEIRDERTAFRQVVDEARGRWWHLAATRIAEEEGEARSILVVRDVSALVKLEESVRLSERLAAMGSLTAGVAHEVRNPLFAISANADALAEVLLEREEVADLLEAIRTEVNRLNGLMVDLLQYGTPSAVTLGEQPLGPALAFAVQLCAVAAKQAGVEVEITGNGRQLVRMDRDRFVQVVENLLENAIQHSPRGSRVTLTSSDFREDGRDWVRCLVVDSGPGFREEDLPRVFEPFFTRRKGGTGLGLSIAQTIVEQHGGRIRAGNRPEGGGLVAVELPCVEGAPARPDAPARPAVGVEEVRKW